MKQWGRILCWRGETVSVILPKTIILERAQTLDRQVDSKIMVLDRLRALATKTT